MFPGMPWECSLAFLDKEVAPCESLVRASHRWRLLLVGPSGIRPTVGVLVWLSHFGWIVHGHNIYCFHYAQFCYNLAVPAQYVWTSGARHPQQGEAQYDAAYIPSLNEDTLRTPLLCCSSSSLVAYISYITRGCVGIHGAKRASGTPGWGPGGSNGHGGGGGRTGKNSANRLWTVASR